jgi:hypothetical protein
MTAESPVQLNIADFFLDARVREGRGNRTALLTDAGRWSYGEVQALANRYANVLSAAGVAPEQRVIIALPDGPDYVAALFGILKIGAVVVMVNPDLKPDAIRYFFEYSRSAAALVAADRASWTLWIALALLAATLIHVRNLYGVVSVLATGALVAAVAWWATPQLQDGFAAALCWFLLFGGLRAVRELQRGLRRGRGRGHRGTSDAEMLAGLTGLPGGMWAALFWLISGLAVIAAAWFLLGQGVL